jgi:hypothetical protein
MEEEKRERHRKVEVQELVIGEFLLGNLNFLVCGKCCPSLRGKRSLAT